MPPWSRLAQPEEFPPDFPQRLDRFRQAAGMSWRGPARRLKVNSRTVRRWKAGAAPGSGHLLSLLGLAAGMGLLHLLHGRDSQTLPERDFTADDWQCKRCPFLNTCLPGSAAPEPEPDGGEENAEPVNDEEAQAALREYENAQEMLKAIEEDKQWALGMLRTWLKQQGKDKARLEGREKTRTVGMVKSTRYNVDHKRLNALLEPETRAGIVTENVSEYLRGS